MQAIDYILSLMMIPVAIILLGVIKIFEKNKAVKRRGITYILIGFAFLGLLLLIGYSVCSK